MDISVYPLQLCSPFSNATQNHSSEPFRWHSCLSPHLSLPLSQTISRDVTVELLVLQVIMVRLQRVTFMALHNYLGLSYELMRSQVKKINTHRRSIISKLFSFIVSTLFVFQSSGSLSADFQISSIGVNSTGNVVLLNRSDEFCTPLTMSGQ